MAVASVLVDKSVWARLAKPEVAAAVEPLISRGEVRTCAIVDLEILFSARTGAEHIEVRKERGGFRRLPITETVWERAVEVQGLLALVGHHRATSIPDLLIAATAEQHGATVLHYDSDFDLIAEVTGQTTRWVVGRGTVD